MSTFRPSSTALLTSLMRSVHSRADVEPIINDPWGELLIPQSLQNPFRERALSGMDTESRAKAESFPDVILDDYLRANVAYADVIMRTRYTEDALEVSTQNGIGQYVIIGAGMDSFSLRTPSTLRDIEIFEIDHPEMQGFKRQRLESCSIEVPERVHYVGVDLSKESLGEVLGRSSFKRDQRAFFSWLGVTMYLTREANLELLRSIAVNSSPGSEIVFTYCDQKEFEPGGGSELLRDLRRYAESVGEPWLSGFHPTELVEDLRRVGLVVIEDVDGITMSNRFGKISACGLRSIPDGHFVHARVAS